MPDKKGVDFPDVENKLQAAPKKSVFERQREQEREKRLKEEAETAAVYEDFVKSFDDEDIPSGPASGVGGFGAPYGAMTGPPKRHFGSSSLGQGRGDLGGRGGFGSGSLGSGPGSLGPPPQSLSKKRTYDGFKDQPRQRDRDRGLLAFEDYDAAPSRKAFDLNDEDGDRHDIRQEQAVAKPTLQLSFLPPGTSPAVIKALLPANLTVDAVRIVPPPTNATTTERKSMSVIVTLAKETPGGDIDAAVNLLQNRYLGYGFYLSLHRHLSSVALSSGANITTTSTATSQPFGAKAVNLDSGPSHGPPGQQRGFAPPTSYAPVAQQLSRAGPLLYVPVQAPKSIKELKLIHKTIENMLTHGPDFEALLMTRPQVQREEKWAWLWDSRSIGGVWYRWRLWEVLTGNQSQRGKGKYLPLFEDSANWKAPEAPLPFEYVTRLDEFVSDSEYYSSDDDESGDEGRGRSHYHSGAPPPNESSLANDDGTSYLNPLEKAKLTHLLARLPTTISKLRKGDVARVTAFAISHAGRGAEEIVASIVMNISHPFSYTSANPDRKKEPNEDENGDEEMADDEKDGKDGQEEDTSSASLIGLYLVSDILSSSSTSGVRHAWRYRQLFENKLREEHVFEDLGRLEKRMRWGRMRAEKWKRSVGTVLTLWEGWCVFPQESQDFFVQVFNTPPVTAEEEEEIEAKKRETAEKGKSKWKAVDANTSSRSDVPEPQRGFQAGDVDGSPMEDEEDGVPMDEDEDDDNIDGVPMEDSDDDEDEMDGELMEEDHEEQSPAPNEITESTPKAPSPQPTVRKRMRAVDMFADSGSDGE